MNDVIEVSYTGDLLGHRRCARAWCYEKQAGFHPYEQVQAMEGRLIHHAMEWLARRLSESGKHATIDELRERLTKYYRVLYARGIKTAFEKKQETLDRVLENIYPQGSVHPTVKAAIEGAQHTEYELKTVRTLLKADFGGKARLLLTGILDLVIQQSHPLVYSRSWRWIDLTALSGEAVETPVNAQTGDVEIWDYKGTLSDTPYVADYVRQLLTYAALFKERSGYLPKRCVLFFVNERERTKQLLVVEVDDLIVEHALQWTIAQVKALRRTVIQFQQSPISVEGGGIDDKHNPVGKRISPELKQQCTACGFRFDCPEYLAYLPNGNQHRDVKKNNIRKA